MDFPDLVAQIAYLPMKFIIFIDDLSFSHQDDTYASLKAVLEGGVAARPENTLIYATSNRRHLVRETFSDRDGDEIHRGDTIQESLSLADRFGLSVNFSLPSKEKYLAIVEELAKTAWFGRIYRSIKARCRAMGNCPRRTVTSLCTSIYEFSRSKNKIGKKCLTDNLYK